MLIACEKVPSTVPVVVALAKLQIGRNATDNKPRFNGS